MKDINEKIKNILEVVIEHLKFDLSDLKQLFEKNISYIENFQESLLQLEREIFANTDEIKKIQLDFSNLERGYNDLNSYLDSSKEFVQQIDKDVAINTYQITTLNDNYTDLKNRFERFVDPLS